MFSCSFILWSFIFFVQFHIVFIFLFAIMPFRIFEAILVLMQLLSISQFYGPQFHIDNVNWDYSHICTLDLVAWNAIHSKFGTLLPILQIVKLQNVGCVHVAQNNQLLQVPPQCKSHLQVNLDQFWWNSKGGVLKSWKNIYDNHL